MFDKLAATEARYRELEEEMSRQEVANDYDRLQALAREHSSLQEIVNIMNEYRRVEKSLGEARAIVSEGGDPELVEMAREEITASEARVEELEAKLRRALIPKDKFDDKDVIVEIRAAAGGDEAGLFAGDLYRMYSLRGRQRGVRSSTPRATAASRGCLQIQEGCFGRLKYSGVHRVQRVPRPRRRAYPPRPQRWRCRG
jgi:peptide chain release factor 1